MDPTVNNQPLAGRSFLIAAGETRTDELAAEIQHAGGRVIFSSTLKISEPESYASLDQAIENLYGYDWLVFTSMHGGETFLRRLRHLAHEVDELDSLRVCAIGETTVRELEESQIHVDVVPEQITSEGAFAA